MNKTHLSIDNKLLLALRAANVSPDMAAHFLYTQALNMQACPPNYTEKQNQPKIPRPLNFHGKYWVMRGFFPKTPIMFKIVMVNTAENYHPAQGPEDGYYAKAELIQPKVQRQHQLKTFVNKELYEKIQNDVANNIILGDSNPDPKIKLTQRHPKCMSPKGCVVYNLRLKD